MNELELIEQSAKDLIEQIAKAIVEKPEEVQVKGVVGEQPRLKPGETFRYTSGTILDTPVGSMQGTYDIVDNSGNHFDAQIPSFSLARPGSLH